MEKANMSPPIIAITPSDATVYEPPLTGIRAGAAGHISIRSKGATVVLSNVAVGEVIAGEINQVLNTGTTATLITGWQW